MGGQLPRHGGVGDGPERGHPGIEWMVQEGEVMGRDGYTC